MRTTGTGVATDTDLGLGGRLPLVTPASMSDRQRRLYDRLAPAKRAEAKAGGYRVETADGSLIGPFNSYLYVPDLSDGYMAWIDAQHVHLPLSAEIREAVILTIGAAWNAPFERYAHRRVARAAGLSDEVIEALATGGDTAGLSVEARVARDFTRALVVEHDVEDELYARAHTAFGDAGLVAMTHLIGLYLSVSAVLKAFRIPAPEAQDEG